MVNNTITLRPSNMSPLILRLEFATAKIDPRCFLFPYEEEHLLSRRDRQIAPVTAAVNAITSNCLQR